MQASAGEQSQLVLVFDPNVRIRGMLARYLRQCGYDVLEAESRDQAMRLAKQNAQNLNVLLCDGTSPGMQSGFGLANWIKVNCPDAEVTLAETPVGAADEARSLCHEKDADIDSAGHAILLDHIRKALAGRGSSASAPRADD